MAWNTNDSFNKVASLVRNQLPPWNFITLHYAYFIFTTLISAIIFWGSATPARSVTFIDSLFMTVSAMTEAGLNTVNISTFNTWQQIMLFLLILIGSAVWVSAFVVHARRIAFERRFQQVIMEVKNKRLECRRLEEQIRSRGVGKSSNWNLLASLPFARSFTSRLSIEQRHTHTQDEEKGRFPDIDSQTIDKESSIGNESIKRTMTRDSTPPARRGGPEMNGISGSTGEAIISDDGESNGALSVVDLHPTAIKFNPTTRFTPIANSAYGPPVPSHNAVKRRHRRSSSSLFSAQGVGAVPLSSISPTHSLQEYISVSRQEADAAGANTVSTLDTYINTVAGWVSRNSQIHGLSEEERVKLGGYEYRAVVYLSWLVPVYLVLWQLLGCLGLGAYIALNRPSVSETNGLNPWWTGAFMAVSAFNNSGMMTLDANMTAFNTSYYTLITMSLLILAGNTCFPVFLRLIVWTSWRLAKRVAQSYPDQSEWNERVITLRFLLDHPRRCYTNLFPAKHTWWLLASVVSLNGVDWAFFEILNLGNKALTLPTNIRVIDGLFQAIAVRSGGFYVVSIPSLRIGLQVLYVIMMYISAYPVVITMRNSNVYEERSLGIYAEDLPFTGYEKPSSSSGDTVHHNDPYRRDSVSPDKANGGLRQQGKNLHNGFLKHNGSRIRRQEDTQFVRAQLRAQLAHDTWWIALALFLIMIIESSQFERDPKTFSVFNFLFEIVSGYGCVGISTGLPDADYSFSGSWHVLSKLILCAVMIRGRHRGLPVAIDKAVLLPGEEAARAEEEDGWRRLALGRSMTSMTRITGVGLSRGWVQDADSRGRSDRASS